MRGGKKKWLVGCGPRAPLSVGRSTSQRRVPLVFPALKSADTGAMELILAGLGNSSGFRETGHGAPVIAQSNPRPQAQVFLSNSNYHAMSTYAQQSSTRGQTSLRPTTATRYKTWKHPGMPGEYGRVHAWLKRTIRDLEMEQDIHGHPPSAVFVDRAEMSIYIPAIPAPAGMRKHLHPTPERRIFANWAGNTCSEKVDKFYTPGR
jgi:hypothetical protein